MASFDDRKHGVLRALASDRKDKSRAGGVDAPIAPLVERINCHPRYFTTSSCSGRVSIFSEPDPDEEPSGTKTRKKKGGDWVYVSHDAAVEREVLESVREYCVTMEDGLLVFRYEPFILALECRTPAAAQLLVACAVSAGFRESGITGMGKRNIVGVRCSIRLEVPIVQAGRMLVTDDYLQFLVALANKKMELNRQRTDSFLIKFIEQVEDQNVLELERSMRFHEQLPSALSPNGACEEVMSANGTHHFHDQSEKISSKDKESKKNLSALKGRQLRILARLSILEGGRLPTVGAVSAGQTEEHGLRNKGDGDVCINTHTVKSSWRTETTGSVPKIKALETDTMPSASNGRGKSDGCSLPAAHLEVRGGPIERLHCWSHTAVHTTEINGHHSLLVYGGFGGLGRHARQGKSLVLDCLTGELKCLETFYAPPPRMSHVAVVVGQRMVVIGGRYDPSTCLGDVCVLDLKTKSWHFPEVTGAHFLSRHRHAAASVGDNIYVFGGMNENIVLGDFYVLNMSSWEWKCINSRGDIPSPRYSCSLAAIGQKLYLFGGRDARRAYRDLHVFCLVTNTWTEQKGFEDLTPRFSHSMTAVGKWLVILGGCPTTHHGTDLLFLDVEQMASQRVPLMQAPLDMLLVRHTTTLVGTRLFVVGGGAACFAFGAKFNVPFSVDVEPFLGTNSSWTMTESITVVSTRPEELSTSGDSSAKDIWSEKRTWIFRIDRNSAKVGKDALKQLGWLDQARKPKVLGEGLHVHSLSQRKQPCICRM